MTREDKQLLLKDLCARLPYGVKANVIYFDWQHDEKIKKCDTDITYGNIYEVVNNWNDCKPYLRPMSSMTEEEENELTGIAVLGGYNNSVFNSFVIVDWLDKKGFDYRGLIPMGLALEAPEGMYETK